MPVLFSRFLEEVEEVGPRDGGRCKDYACPFGLPRALYDTGGGIATRKLREPGLNAVARDTVIAAGSMPALAFVCDSSSARLALLATD